MDIKIIPKNLTGKVKVPSSKSLTHRAIIAASLSAGKSKLTNITLSEDIKATIECMKALGATFEIKDEVVEVRGIKIVEKENIKTLELACNESGSTLRFLIPIALSHEGEYLFTGKGRLVKRPQSEYYKMFVTQNIFFEKLSSDDELPLKIVGKLSSGEFQLRGDLSSQFITGLLLALPLLEGDSVIELVTPLESKGYVDLTRDILKKFQIETIPHAHKYYVKGQQKYQKCNLSVEGDYSQAAFWLVAGAISRKSEIIVLNVEPNSLQGDLEIVNILSKIGVLVKYNSNSLAVFSSSFSAFEVDISQIPDLGPILTVLACFAKGKSRIYNGTRLRLKESDRITSMVAELKKMGASIQEIDDEIFVEGKEMLLGECELSCWGDHRVAMALSIAAIRCINPITLKGAECVNKSYINFWREYNRLGGKTYELNLV
ncbi:MAG: 3-phosphoshikimate 1-carboxyvinyltransferase [Fusobacteria bacterium]|nr:3-phosphoshikimate 1-carboxyvinyltransferase [Fusobacteriota bacterium]